VAALVVAGVVFAVFAFATGREPGLSEPEPDGVFEPLPDHPLSADDLERARFDVVLRGYRMDQVDALVSRAVSDLRQLQEYADSLEGQLAAQRRNAFERSAQPERPALAERSAPAEQPAEDVIESPAERPDVSAERA